MGRGDAVERRRAAPLPRAAAATAEVSDERRHVSLDKHAVTLFEGAEFDISGFEDNHPGGSALLRLSYERDCTGMVYSYHPNIEKVRAVMTKLNKRNRDAAAAPAKRAGASRESTYFRGPTLERDMVYDSEFYTVLKQRVNQYFKDNNEKRRGGLLGKSLFLLAVVCSLYYASLFVSFWFAPLLGVGMSMIGLCIQHDANHGAFSASGTLNAFMGHLDDLIGGSVLTWIHQHSVGHHVHCNDHEGDEDTKTGLPMLRFNPQMEHWAHMRFQHLYAPLLLSMIGVTAPYFDMRDYFDGGHGEVKFFPMRFKDHAIFLGLKLAYALHLFVFPIYVLGFSDFLLKWYLPNQLIGGLYLAMLFAVSHNNEHCEYNVRDTKDWAEIQVRTSANWSSESWYWNYACGGLNCQIEHHLFPGVAHRHYPNLVPIVRKTCAEFGIPYNAYPTFTSIAIALFKRLYYLGNPDKLKAKNLQGDKALIDLAKELQAAQEANNVKSRSVVARSRSAAAKGKNRSRSASPARTKKNK